MSQSVARAIRLVPATVVATLVVAGCSPLVPGHHGSAGKGRQIAVCQVRACLYLVDPTTDSDGDGVSDVDEKALGTDPKDPKSHPPAESLVNLLLERKLPSFERHFT